MQISISCVEKMLASQFPDWGHLPIRPVPVSGWDNRSFRCGDDLLIRLPSAEQYAPQVHKEQTWLPQLSSALSVAIPAPVGLGVPTDDYPWHWSVYQWIEGDTPDQSAIDKSQLAADLARVLLELQHSDATDGPKPGTDNFYRGGSLQHYDNQARDAISELAGKIDAQRAARVWHHAVTTHWELAPVWVHGDVSPGNLLVRHHRLFAVIDFGLLAVGDPACDLAIAWNYFDDEARQLFKSHLAVDDDTWLRGSAWALWKAVITLAEQEDLSSDESIHLLGVIDAIVTEMDAFDVL